MQFFDNGTDALIYLEKSGPPDILITDMLMPEINGLKIRGILNISHTYGGNCLLLNQWEIPVPYIEAALHYRDPSIYDGENRGIVNTHPIGSHIARRRLNQEIFNYPLQMNGVKAIDCNSEDIEGLIRSTCTDPVA